MTSWITFICTDVVSLEGEKCESWPCQCDLNYWNTRNFHYWFHEISKSSLFYTWNLNSKRIKREAVPQAETILLFRLAAMWRLPIKMTTIIMRRDAGQKIGFPDFATRVEKWFIPLVLPFHCVFIVNRKIPQFVDSKIYYTDF